MLSEVEIRCLCVCVHAYVCNMCVSVCVCNGCVSEQDVCVYVYMCVYYACIAKQSRQTARIVFYQLIHEVVLSINTIEILQCNTL